jgi:hypothetical protein
LALRRDLGQFDISLKLRLAVRQFGVGFGLFCLSFRLKDGSLGVDLGDFLLRATLFLGFADLTAHSGFGDINFSLIEGTFVRFAAQEGKVFASGGVLQFLDVGVVTAGS